MGVCHLLEGLGNDPPRIKSLYLNQKELVELGFCVHLYLVPEKLQYKAKVLQVCK